MIYINLFNLFAKISLDDKEFKNGVNSAKTSGKGLTSAFSSIGSGITALAGATVKAIGVASVAITGLATMSIKSYAEYEQLVGGVETLFKDSAGLVKEYSENAYKTAGLSANKYMETITGFSASLLQGLGGDTQKAAEVGNKAVVDMSDNANKMGTSIEMIQNAYQGFAKQNYTMLDNLKLGYGGTKEEMQRLLVEAGKVSGITYDISNFSDVIEAIHIIQTEIGITGTTSLEASQTISGSFNAMKSSWSNLLTGMSDDTVNFSTLIDNFIESAGTFGANLLPRIKIALDGIGQLVTELAGKLPGIIGELLPVITESAVNVITSLINSFVTATPMLIETGKTLLTTLIEGIKTSLPAIVSSALDILTSLINGLIEVLPMLLEVGLQALITLGQGIADSLPTLIPTILDLVISLCDMIIENLPLIINTAIDIILALVEGLVKALPTLIAEVPRIINSFSDTIYNALPQILKAGIDILMMLIKGLIESIPVLIANLPQIIMAIINAFTMVNWWNIGKDLIVNIGKGIWGMVKNIGKTAKDLGKSVLEGIKGIFTGGTGTGAGFITNIINGLLSLRTKALSSIKEVGSNMLNGIKNVLSWDNLKNVGSNLIQGLWNGISNMGGWIMDKIGGFASGIIDGVKDFFGIHSPSKVFENEVGVYLAQGLGVGFDKEFDNVNKDIETSLQYDYNASINPNINNKGTENNMLGAIYGLLKTIADNGINLDGREVARGLAPYQDEFNEYNTRFA